MCKGCVDRCQSKRVRALAAVPVVQLRRHRIETHHHFVEVLEDFRFSCDHDAIGHDGGDNAVRLHLGAELREIRSQVWARPPAT